MNKRIRIDGVYDHKTIKRLRNISVSDYLFDFRTKSFNFLQLHRFVEIFKEIYSPMEKYFLLFENEQDFVVKKILSDLQQQSNFVDSDGNFNNVFLEFNDEKEVLYYDSFAVPFYTHFSENRRLLDLLKSQYIKGVVFNYSYLEDLHNRGLFVKFISNFYQLVYKEINQRKIEIVLCVDWSDDIFPSFMDYLDFDLIAFPINAKVEKDYRDVNLDIIEQELRIQKQNLLS